VIAVISLLVVISVGLIVTRVATVALTLTGLSSQSARFQARSAFTGSGFTTSESEQVVNHPVRRRIVMLLMLTGSAGIVSVIGTLLLSFLKIRSNQGWERGGVLVGGLIVLVALSRSRLVDRWMSRVIERWLKRYTRLDVRDYASLLHLSGEWQVIELNVDEGDWLADRELQDLDLPHEGVLVLGVQRPDGRYLGAPTGATCVHAGDTVLLYGRRRVLDDLDVRPRDERGEQAHHQAKILHSADLFDQEYQDRDDAVDAAGVAAGQ
jgi:NhaP-type Na+/H+ and K+/H+ antiporter